MNQNKEKPDRDRALSEVEGHTINRIEKDWRSIEDEMWADVDALEELLRMNSLPAGWSVKPLGEVATLQRGFDLPVHERTPGKIPVFAANGLVGTHNVAKVKGPGVVTGRSGTLGEVHYVKNDFWALNTALWVKDFHGNDPKWVARLLKWMRLETHTRGTGVPTLNRNLVHVVPVIVPPIAQQRRIAAILDRADAVRRKRKEAIALTEELLRSAFLEMFGDPVTNPKGWETLTIGELAVVGPQNGLYRPASDYGSGTPIIRIDSFYDGNITAIHKLKRMRIDNDLIKLYGVNYGDILINRVNSPNYLGKSALVPQLQEDTVFESNMMRLAVDPERADPRFIVTQLQDPWIKGQIQQKSRDAVNQSSINQSDVKSFKLRLPPLETQKKFVNFFENLQHLRQAINAALEEENSLFNSLLQKAFRGEL